MAHVKTIQVTFSGKFAVLDDVRKCEEMLDDVVAATSLTKLESIHHKFQPQGVSIVQLLAESHIAVHTWPEMNQGYITMTTCNVDSIDEVLISNIFTRCGFIIGKLSCIDDGEI